MRLALSPSALDGLADLVEALHSPFDYPDVDGWRHEVNRLALGVLDAHKVVFMLPGEGHAPVYCQRLDPDGFRAYVDYYHRFDIAGSIALQRGLTIASLLEIHGPDEFYASEYYNDFMRVWECNHSVGLVTPIDTAPGYAYLGILRDQKEDGPFSPQTRALMRLILPAFRAGVLSYLRLASDQAVLGAVLDASEKRLLVCDRSGQPSQSSAALERTLAADTQRVLIEQEMRSLARVTAALGRPTAGVRMTIDRAGERVVTTARGGYRLTACLAGAGSPAPAGVLLLLEPLFRELFGDGEIRDRFGLTKQELRVARHIASGLRNDALAQRLGISPHTARRHTERVLEKLGVASRRQVAERISRG